jgi:hypothetical protein
MGVDPVTAGLIIGGGSQLLGLGLGANEASRSRREAGRTRRQAQGMMQTGPSEIEQLLKAFAGPGGGASGNQAFNAGQDSLSQMLRSDGGLQQMASTGNPFDTSAMFAALAPVEERMQQQQLAGLRGSAGTGQLGARFGTAFANAEGGLRAQMADESANRRAGIQQSAFENAQQRRLAATDQLTGAASASGQLGLSQMGMLLQALTGAGQLGSQRASTNAALMGAASIPTPGGFGQQVAQSGADMATLLYLLNNNRQRPQMPTYQAPPININTPNPGNFGVGGVRYGR